MTDKGIIFSAPGASTPAQEVAASAIAIEICGRPERCTGWKAKIFNAACAGAARGIEVGEALSRNRVADATDTLSRARVCAEQALMSKLSRARVEKRDSLRSRIAWIRSGTGDDLPEVQSALLALDYSQFYPVAR